MSGCLTMLVMLSFIVFVFCSTKRCFLTLQHDPLSTDTPLIRTLSMVLSVSVFTGLTVFNRLVYLMAIEMTRRLSDLLAFFAI